MNIILETIKLHCRKQQVDHDSHALLSTPPELAPLMLLESTLQKYLQEDVDTKLQIKIAKVLEETFSSDFAMNSSPLRSLIIKVASHYAKG